MLLLSTFDVLRRLPLFLSSAFTGGFRAQEDSFHGTLTYDYVLFYA